MHVWLRLALIVSLTCLDPVWGQRPASVPGSFTGARPQARPGSNPGAMGRAPDLPGGSIVGGTAVGGAGLVGGFGGTAPAAHCPRCDRVIARGERAPTIAGCELHAGTAKSVEEASAPPPADAIPEPNVPPADPPQSSDRRTVAVSVTVAVGLLMLGLLVLRTVRRATAV